MSVGSVPASVASTYKKYIKYITPTPTHRGRYYCVPPAPAFYGEKSEAREVKRLS